MLGEPVVDSHAVAGGGPPGRAWQATNATSECGFLFPLDVADEEGGDDAIDEGVTNEVPGVEVIEELDFVPTFEMGPEAFAGEVEVQSELIALDRFGKSDGTDVAGGSPELDEPVGDAELVGRVEILERLAELDGESGFVKIGAQGFVVDGPVWRNSLAIPLCNCLLLLPK